MSDKGYIRINRKLFEHRLWCEAREFSTFEAWLDLIKSSRFEDATQDIGKYQTQLVKRGQMIASIRFLSERWKWSTKKVLRYLHYLEEQKMITRETPKETGITTVTLLNYDTYNPITSTKESRKETPRKHQGNTKETNIKNYNKLESNYNISSNEDIVGAPFENFDSLNSEIPEKEKSCGEKEKRNFEKFQLWIKTNASSVARMKEPFTFEQFEMLKSDFNIEFIQELLLEMHNWKPLLSKNINANSTFRRWAKKEKSNANNTHNSTAPSLHIDTKGKYPDKP